MRSVPEPPSLKRARHPSSDFTGKAKPTVPPAPQGIRMMVPDISG
uniref:Uncharacterized protein n=1 Tax=Myoviridae sp. ctq8k5 TaxID=2826701 RepID=A0A8S5QY41_9CAUD|nr:MAG TPA: hypothetical protein [Myoviridae sp. ctq8k5]